MAINSIPEDASLEDIVKSLSKPEEYVRRALENMFLCKRKHGSAYLRLGVLGAGKIPNYRVEYLGKAGEVTASFTGCDEVYIVYGAFNGRSHAEMDGVSDYDLEQLINGDERPERILQYGNWSTKVTHIEGVQKLLGKVREDLKRK